MILRNILATTLIAVAANVLVAVPFAGELRGLSIDLMFLLRDTMFGPRHGPAESQVVVMGIDEETYRRPPFRSLPKVMWTRQIGNVIDSMIEGGARIIGFDIIFSTSVEQLRRGYDREFLRTLRRASKAGKLILGKVQHQEKPISPYAGYSFAVGHNKNIRSMNVFEDGDGVIRRVPLFFRSSDIKKGNRIETSMSLEVASRFLSKRPEIKDDGTVTLDGYRIPANDQSAMLVNFAGGAGAIPTYSLADLFACSQDGNKKKEYFRGHFKDKAVFLGVVLDVEDRKITSKRLITTPDGLNAPKRCKIPVMEGLTRKDLARDSVPGVYIHATAVNNLLRRDVPRELGKIPDLGLALGLTLVSAVPGILLAPVLATAVVVAGIAVWAAFATAAFNAALVVPLLNPVAAILLTFAALLGYRFAIADKDKRYLRSAFSLYLPATVVDRLVDSQSPPALGGETRELSAFFSDIQSFTSISESLDPPTLVRFLNVYLSVITDIIEEHNGFVDKYIGDAVVGVFGAPLADEDHARHAVEAALACQKRLAESQAEFGLPDGALVATRIGINSGEMLVGNIGSSRRFNYTVMGDAVNVAARLEGANKAFGTYLLVSQRTRELCGDTIIFREVDRVRVVGREEPITLFQPLAGVGELSPDDERQLSTFSSALEHYHARRFEEAKRIFAELAPDDPLAAVYLKRTGGLMVRPLADDWDGVTDLESK
jgi:class 3 adenylate cyclase/CHASE2 domain-containing sensor protein